MMQKVIGEQNSRLIAYAKEQIIVIGDKISSYHSRNHMDRTGNLLDSLLWGVSYRGKLVQGGFYREARASETSYLHEWFSGDEKYLEPVNGRELAAKYLETYGNNGQGNGWKVFFAILAPYWGYWENGFNMKRRIGKNGWDEDDAVNYSTRFMRFAVMSQFYDRAKSDLKPARVRFRHPVSKYNHEKIKKRWKKYAGI